MTDERWAESNRRTLLGQRAASLTEVAESSGLPKWEWLPAMRLDSGGIITLVHFDGHAATTRHGARGVNLRGQVPDIQFWGTMGAIEHNLIPWAWDDDVTITHIDGPREHSTTVANHTGWVLFRASGSKDERLVATLEAAP